MLKFNNLEKVSVDELVQTFNASFADYLVKMQLTPDQLEKKLISDSVDLKLSVGVYEDTQLVGFILHGINIVKGKTLAYNAGTGIIPSYRGQKLTQKMYEFIFPSLQKRGITRCLLEVLEKNFAAIKSYNAVGFKLNRELVCLKGIPKFSGIKKNIAVTELDPVDWALVPSFWDWEPSWQNSIIAMQNLAESNKSIGIYDDEKLVAYAIYNPLNNRVAQFAVHPSYRRKGYGKALFQYIFNSNPMEISVINVAIEAGSTLTFLGTIGLLPYINQYEMDKNL